MCKSGSQRKGAALLDADRDYDIKVLVLKANGKGFCSGHAIGDNAVDYPAFVEGAMRMGHPWKPELVVR